MGTVQHGRSKGREHLLFSALNMSFHKITILMYITHYPLLRIFDVRTGLKPTLRNLSSIFAYNSASNRSNDHYKNFCKNNKYLTNRKHIFNPKISLKHGKVFSKISITPFFFIQNQVIFIMIIIKSQNHTLRLRPLITNFLR